MELLALNSKYKLLKRKPLQRIPYQILNISNGKSIKLKYFLKLIEEELSERAIIKQVDVSKKELSQSRVDLLFEFTEGELVKVNKINFFGNKVFSNNKLKSVIKT